MPAATLTEKGQIVIPARIRARYELTPGTQVEFVDEGGSIRLVARRRVAASDPAAGYGLIKVPRSASRAPRRLADFDPAAVPSANVLSLSTTAASPAALAGWAGIRK